MNAQLGNPRFEIVSYLVAFSSRLVILTRKNRPLLDFPPILIFGGFNKSRALFQRFLRQATSWD